MKKYLSFLLAMVIFVGLLSPITSADIVYKEPPSEVLFAELLTTLGIISGDSNGNLNIEGELTRGQLIAIVSKLMTNDIEGYTPPSSPSFKDVPATHWAYNFVELAKEKGVTNGKSDGTFGINDKVSMKQALAFLLNLKQINFKWEEVFELANEEGLVYEQYKDSSQITRGQFFRVVASLLYSEDSKTNYMFYFTLIDHGVLEDYGDQGDLFYFKYISGLSVEEHELGIPTVIPSVYADQLPQIAYEVGLVNDDLFPVPVKTAFDYGTAGTQAEYVDTSLTS